MSEAVLARHSRAVPAVKFELFLTLGQTEFGSGSDGHHGVRIRLAQVTLLLRQTRNAAADQIRSQRHHSRYGPEKFKQISLFSDKKRRVCVCVFQVSFSPVADFISRFIVDTVVSWAPMAVTPQSQRPPKSAICRVHALPPYFISSHNFVTLFTCVRACVCVCVPTKRHPGSHIKTEMTPSLSFILDIRHSILRRRHNGEFTMSEVPLF